jgi:hypothetical protein
MSGRNQSEKIVVRAKEVLVGIDVHKETWRLLLEWRGKRFLMGV